MTVGAELRRLTPRPLRPLARIVLGGLRRLVSGSLRMVGLVVLKARNAVGHVRNKVPAPQLFWPDVKGLEAVLLSGALKLLPFQQRVLHALGRQGRHLRRFRGRIPIVCPVKVLHVTCSFDLGGTQRQIMNLCEHQDGAPFVHDAIEIFPEQNYLYRQDVQLEPARYTGPSVMSRMMGRLTLNLSTRSAQTVQIYKLARDFRALRPDVVVGWGHEMCALAFLAAALERVPHIVFCIRTFNPNFGWTTPAMARLLKVLHGQMQPSLSGIITNSTLLRDDYAAWLGIAPSEIRVCPNGIQTEPATADRTGRRERIRRQFDIRSDALVLCNIGRFSAEKGQMLMMRANERLIDRYAEKTPIWLLCGDGPLLPDVQRFVAERGMSNVRFAGRIDDVDGYLSASDVFVMPSDFEGMPNAMMEAMAHGLPCVSTDRTGALDIARDGVEALYCAVGASDGLAARLCALIEDPAERIRIGANARERIKEFSVERVTRTFNSCLQEIVNQAPPAVVIRGDAPSEVMRVGADHGSGGAE